jgi:hypothetical protein
LDESIDIFIHSWVYTCALDTCKFLTFPKQENLLLSPAQSSGIDSTSPCSLFYSVSYGKKFFSFVDSLDADSQKNIGILYGDLLICARNHLLKLAQIVGYKVFFFFYFYFYFSY